MKIQVLLNKVICPTGGIQPALSRRDGVALILFLRGGIESYMNKNPVYFVLTSLPQQI